MNNGILGYPQKNINNIDFNTLKCSQNQRLSIPPDTWITIGSLSDSGIINKIWLALNDTNSSGLNVRNGLIKIEFNGATIAQFGGEAGIKLQDLFGPSLDSSLTYRTPRMGVTKNTTSGFSGFLRCPMPFSKGAIVKLRINSNALTSVQSGSIVMSGTSDYILTTPDSSSTSPTGDLEWIIDFSLSNWATHQTLISKWVSISNNRSFGFEVDSSGKLLLFWSSTGADTLYKLSTVATGWTAGSRHKIRARLDVDNGAGGHTVTFEEYIDSSWISIGSPVVTAGITSVYNSSAQTVIGGGDDGTSNFCTGTLYEVTLNDSIDGIPRFTCNPSTQSDNITAWSASTGETWSIAGASTTPLEAWSMIEYTDTPIQIGDVKPQTSWILNATTISSNLSKLEEQIVLDINDNILLLGWHHRCSTAGGQTDFNYLEGDYKIYFGSEKTPSYQSSGTEDMYDSSFYFLEGLFQDIEEGIFIKNTSNGNFSAYKMFWDSILPKDKSKLRFTWKNGDPGYLEPTYSVISSFVLFYYLIN